MPKSKRSREVHLTKVDKKTREHKDRLFEKIRSTVPQFQHCLVFRVENMRNAYFQEVRRDLSACSIFLGKTKLMARALGTTPETAAADNLDRLAPHLRGDVGLLFTNDSPQTILDYFAGLSHVDFARKDAVAPRGFAVPPGVVYATGGEVPAEHDVPLEHTLEPELRKLGVPTRLVRGKVVLGNEDGTGSEGYVVCKEGDVLDSRQASLLKLFGVCLAEFRVHVTAYWSAATGDVTVVKDDEAESGGE